MNENGIDLADFLNALIHRKWLILAGTAVFVMTAAVVTVLLPKQYETNMIMELAIAAGEPVEDNYLVEQVIDSGSFLAAVQDRLHGKTSGQVTRILGEGDKLKSQTIISIQVTASSPQAAVNAAEKVADLIAERQKVYFDEKMKIWEGYAEELRKKIQDTGQEITGIRQSTSKLLSETTTPTSAVVMLQAQLEQKESQQMSLLRELRDANLELSKVRSRNTHIVSPATYPASPRSRNFRLNISMALMTGVFMSVLLVFFLEYLHRVRTKVFTDP